MDNNVYICILQYATLAQSVEQRIRNAQVASSSLTSGSTKKRRASMPSAFSFVILTDIVRKLSASLIPQTDYTDAAMVFLGVSILRQCLGTDDDLAFS